MHKIINEGSIKIKIPDAGRISKGMGVFYNPVMSLNRDISVLLLNSIKNDHLQIADPLAATGVRSVRFLKELSKNKIKSVGINDCDKDSVELIKQNLALNKIQFKRIEKISIKNEDASLFLLNSAGFDYIEIDPFGNANPFLDAACKRLARGGILAVTATDTSALCGTFPHACIRKYWAVPKKDAVMHETGLRILIRKVQLVAAQYDKALVPVFSYSKEHYMRTFLKNEKGKSKVDDILSHHAYFNDAGPMWIGNLWNKNLAVNIYKNAIKNNIFKNDKDLIRFLKIIKDESKINAVGFYDLHDICKKNEIQKMEKKEMVIDKIRKSGYTASETHFCGHCIRSGIPLKDLIRILKKTSLSPF